MNKSFFATFLCALFTIIPSCFSQDSQQPFLAKQPVLVIKNCFEKSIYATYKIGEKILVKRIAPKSVLIEPHITSNIFSLTKNSPRNAFERDNIYTIIKTYEGVNYYKTSITRNVILFWTNRRNTNT